MIRSESVGAAALALEPVPISGDLVFLRLQAGGQFTCGIPPLELLAYGWGGGVVGGQTTTPTLVSDQFQFRELSAGDNFSIKMLITSGRGMFEAYVGQRPLSIDAGIVFGPPETPGGPPTMVERFEIGGRLCEA